MYHKEWREYLQAYNNAKQINPADLTWSEDPREALIMGMWGACLLLYRLPYHIQQAVDLGLASHLFLPEDFGKSE